MAKEKEPLLEDRSNGDDPEYNEFLDEMKSKGFPVVDAMEFAEGGIGLIQPPEVKHSNAALVASVPDARTLYDKGDKVKGVLLDLMARTNFRSDNEMKYFLDWVEWCEDFGVGYDGPMRFIVALNSVLGMARSQYVDVMTTYRAMNRSNNNYYGKQPKPRFKEGELN